jgi:hypothetical protein
MREERPASVSNVADGCCVRVACGAPRAAVRRPVFGRRRSSWNDGVWVGYALHVLLCFLLCGFCAAPESPGRCDFSCLPVGAVSETPQVARSC